VVAKFLADHPEFSLEQTGAFLPQPRQAEMVQLYPQRDGTDGFFIARMCKRKG
jgi:16S rRNA (cytosine967-C5)-methyltransferase